jgi:hypothetical protein
MMSSETIHRDHRVDRARIQHGTLSRYLPSVRRVWGFVLVLLFLLLPPGGAQAQAPQPPLVHVRGSPRIEARASRSQGKLALSGTVVDDAARPVAGARVSLSVTTRADPNHTLSLSLASPSPCTDAAGSPTPLLERSDTLVLPTDGGGRFCVRLALGIDRYVAHLGVPAAGHLDAAQTDLTLDLSVQPLALRFDPPPRAISLDEPPAALEAVASVEEDGTQTPAPDVALTLTNEAGAVLGTAQTNAQG